MKLAVIPARGGSKRIPRKNIRDFCGKPMIAWSIEAAMASGCFDAVVVSTDDAEIAEVARSWGASVPFMRPAELADDHTGTMAVVRHCLGHFAAAAVAPGHACCIYATAPMLEPTDLRAGLEILVAERADYALAVTSYAFPIQRAIRIGSDRRMHMFSPEQFGTRSQDLEPAWHDAGQFCWGLSAAWMAGRPVFGAASVPVPLPRSRVQDIDTPEDWTLAERMFRALRRPI